VCVCVCVCVCMCVCSGVTSQRVEWVENSSWDEMIGLRKGRPPHASRWFLFRNWRPVTSDCPVSGGWGRANKMRNDVEGLHCRSDYSECAIRNIASSHWHSTLRWSRYQASYSSRGRGVDNYNARAIHYCATITSTYSETARRVLFAVN